MGRTGSILVVGLVLVGCAESPPDPDVFLANATRALGAGDLRTIEYIGDGWDTSFGQAWSVQESWPRWSLLGYDRVIDYEAGTSRHTAQRQSGMDPDKLGGGGAQPGTAPTTQRSAITPDSPWSQRLIIYFTPYGFLRLAADQDARVELVDLPDGQDEYVLSFDVPDGGATHAMRGYFGQDSRLRRIETWLDDPVLGDMLVEVEFADYRDVGGIEFPMHILERRGGLAYKELSVSSVVPNAAIEAPDPAADGGAFGGRGGGGRGGRGAGAAQAETPPSLAIGEGVWVVTGGYQSTVVEFSDYVVVIEGAQNAARSQTIITEAMRLTNGKPIRYFVTTHTHFDHIGGIRDFVAQGATIVVNDMDVEWYERALNTPHTLNPDLAERLGARPVIEGAGDGYVIEDQTQRIELYKINGSLHAADMMIAYLPSVRMIVEADMVQPWLSGAFEGAFDGPHPFLVHLKSQLDLLGLDFEGFLPVHAPNPPPSVPRSVFEAAVGEEG